MIGEQNLAKTLFATEIKAWAPCNHWTSSDKKILSDPCSRVCWKSPLSSKIRSVLEWQYNVVSGIQIEINVSLSKMPFKEERKKQRKKPKKILQFLCFYWCVCECLGWERWSVSNHVWVFTWSCSGWIKIGICFKTSD